MNKNSKNVFRNSEYIQNKNIQKPASKKPHFSQPKFQIPKYCPGIFLEFSLFSWDKEKSLKDENNVIYVSDFDFNGVSEQFYVKKNILLENNFIFINLYNYINISYLKFIFIINILKNFVYFYSILCLKFIYGKYSRHERKSEMKTFNKSRFKERKEKCCRQSVNINFGFKNVYNVSLRNVDFYEGNFNYATSKSVIKNSGPLKTLKTSLETFSNENSAKEIDLFGEKVSSFPQNEEGKVISSRESLASGDNPPTRESNIAPKRITSKKPNAINHPNQYYSSTRPTSNPLWKILILFFILSSTKKGFNLVDLAAANISDGM